jgi:hypothetical protein
MRLRRYPGLATAPALVECAGSGCIWNLRDYAMREAGAGLDRRWLSSHKKIDHHPAFFRRSTHGDGQ